MLVTKDLRLMSLWESVGMIGWQRLVTMDQNMIRQIPMQKKTLSMTIRMKKLFFSRMANGVLVADTQIDTMDIHQTTMMAIEMIMLLGIVKG